MARHEIRYDLEVDCDDWHLFIMDESELLRFLLFAQIFDVIEKKQRRVLELLLPLLHTQGHQLIWDSVEV